MNSLAKKLAAQVASTYPAVKQPEVPETFPKFANTLNPILQQLNQLAGTLATEVAGNFPKVQYTNTPANTARTSAVNQFGNPLIPPPIPNPDTPPNIAGTSVNKMNALQAGLQGGVGGLVKGAFSNTSGFNIANMLGQSSFAAMGPVGLIIQAIPALAKQLGPYAALPYAAITKGLSGISSGLRALQGPLGPVGAFFDTLSGFGHGAASAVKKIPIVGDFMGPQMDALAAVPDILKDITNSLVNMGRIASPGVFKKWEIALLDVQGVIGLSFLPVLDMMSDGVRLVGDVMATILPSFGEAERALAGARAAWDNINETIRGVVADVGPIIRDHLIGALQFLGANLRIISFLVRDVATSFHLATGLLRATYRLLGIGSDSGMRTSVGAAARPASITSIQAYQDQLQRNAYMASSTGTRSPEERSAVALEGILNILGRVDFSRLGEWRSQVAGAADMLLFDDPFGIRRSVLGF